MRNRSATDTIKGYFYQFDYSIVKLLNLTNESDKITVEGIEDVDIEAIDKSVAIQCKYYAKTTYNHSIIGKPIREMLTHFKGLKDKNKSYVKYHLYGHYKSGQEKLLLPVDVNFLKDKFLTYKQSKVVYKHHEVLNLDDNDLTKFISLLSIDINAKDYESQRNNIIQTLKSIFACSEFYAEYGLYNSALNEIRKLAIQDSIESRKLSKKEFLDRIDKKECLFNLWFLELKGKKLYHREMREKYFKSVLNKKPIERLFIIEPPSNTRVSDLKDLISIISSKYSNLKKRETQNYCPYIYFHCYPKEDLAELKRQLFNEDFKFIDGYPFRGCAFSEKAISEPANDKNMINIKFIDKEDQISKTFAYITKRREIYQFYFGSKVHLPVDDIKTINIQIQELNSIKEII